MNAPEFYLNGSKINPPQNWKELSIECNFDRDQGDDFQNEAVIGTNDWDFVRENTDKILAWIEGGLNGQTPGIFEGIPLKINIESANVQEPIFDGYIDLTESPNLSCIKTTVTAKERKQIEWLSDVADSFTFEYLFRETKEILPSDFVFVPYVLNSVPNYRESAIALISVFVIGEQIKAVITHLSELVTEAANPFEATALIRAVLYILYLTVLIASIIKLIKDLINVLIQPVKYHAGMRVKDSLRIASAHIGLTFKSDFFDEEPYSKAVVIPEKYYNPVNADNENIFGFTSPNLNEQEGFYKGTFGDFLRAMKSVFKAKIVLTSNNELILIRKDKTQNSPQYQLGDFYQPYYTTNANELKSNYLLTFAVDQTDKNTIQEYTGTSYQVLTQPKSYNNLNLRLTKGLEEVRIPFALAKRKTELTTPEKIIKGLLDIFSGLVNGITTVINALINLYNKIVKVINKTVKALNTIGIKISFDLKPIKQLPKIDLGASIENRINMMMIETDIISVPKIMLIDEGSQAKFNKLSPGNEIYLSAKQLYLNFHYIQSFIPSLDRPTANQYIIKEFKKVPFCLDDYLLVKNNNFIKDANGNPAEIVSLKWNPFDQVAELKVRFPQLYTNNLTEVSYEATGV